MIEQDSAGAALFAHTSHNPANANSRPSGPGRPGLDGGAVAAAAERGAYRDAHVPDGRHARLTKRFLHREDGELLGVVPQRLTPDHDAPVLLRQSPHLAEGGWTKCAMIPTASAPRSVSCPDATDLAFRIGDDLHSPLPAGASSLLAANRRSAAFGFGLFFRLLVHWAT